MLSEPTQQEDPELGEQQRKEEFETEKVEERRNALPGVSEEETSGCKQQ